MDLIWPNPNYLEPRDNFMHIFWKEKKSNLRLLWTALYHTCIFTSHTSNLLFKDAAYKSLSKNIWVEVTCKKSSFYSAKVMVVWIYLLCWKNANVICWNLHVYMPCRVKPMKKFTIISKWKGLEIRRVPFPPEIY